MPSSSAFSTSLVGFLVELRRELFDRRASNLNFVIRSPKLYFERNDLTERAFVFRLATRSFVF